MSRSKTLSTNLFAAAFIALCALPLHLHGQAAGGASYCNDTLFSSSAACQALAGNAAAAPTPASVVQVASPDSRNSRASEQVYVDTGGLDTRRTATSADRNQTFFPPDPLTDMQKLARESTGELVPLFGRDLFQSVPSTFAPADQIPVTPDYVVGPGDEVLVRLYGAEASNSQLTVDTAGNIYIPKVGTVQVAGLRYDELEKRISGEVNRIFRNYRISVSLGHLRSLQVYVVGEARRPGAYTVSSFSTVLNALFDSGGPNVRGSMRHIQVRRAGQALPEFDLYDLVLRGDKSKDIRLQPGDTIFIPPVGPQAAIAGSVGHPAIYELKDGNTVSDVLALAGGFSATAVSTQLTLERIAPDHVRQAISVSMDTAGRGVLMHDGDVLYANHITAGYAQSVTLRGNLANPGRFAWRPGLRIADIIPDRRSLLTNNYWSERNRLGVPVPLFEPASGNPPSTATQTAQAPGSASSAGSRTGNTGSGVSSQAGPIALPSTGLAGTTSGATLNRDGAPDTPTLNAEDASRRDLSSGSLLAEPSGSSINHIRIPAPEINWSYAVIERLDPQTLKNSLVPFNLGKLLQDHDASQNLELQPGDVVTILSQRDNPVPLEEQTKYIRLAGEFKSAGVYSVGPNETLDQLIRRAGGFSSKAYLYGSSFLRESARAFQQQRLDEYLSELSADMERAVASRAASTPTGILDPNALAEQRSLIAQLRQLRATGRVVLEFKPESAGDSNIPAIPLENGDVFLVPSRPITVNVIGAVYGQNVFLFHPDRRLEDYLALAGKTNRIADKKHAFIIRADGSIYSRERAKGAFSNSFNSTLLNPGDSIVVPEKLIKPSALRQLIDYSQVLSSFGLAAAAINVIR